MFSVLVLTFNEARNLLRCLESVQPCSDMVVLDSGSTDGTQDIARQLGARVFVRPFDNFAGQRNHAREHIPFRYEWVFHLDADETLTPELQAECTQVANRGEEAHDGWLVAPKMYFQGRWIPHCTDFPAYQARFVHARRFEFIQVGHGQREAPHMRMGRLRSNYLHDLSADGTEAWLAKHRRYAHEEAVTSQQSIGHAHWNELLNKDALVRRRALKRLSQRIPCRPQVRFLYQYLLRGGMFDGRPGYRYCRLLMQYERFIDEAMRAQGKRSPLR